MRWWHDLRDDVLRVVGGCVVVGVAGGFAFSHGLGWMTLACVGAGALHPAGFAVHALAALLPGAAMSIHDGASVLPVALIWPWLLACSMLGADLGRQLRGTSPRGVLVVLQLIGAWMLVSIVTYPIAKLSWASVQTDRLCRVVHVGDPIAHLEQRARAFGLDASSHGEIVSIKGDKRLPPAIEGEASFLFASFTCAIYHDGSRVTALQRIGLG